VGSSSEVGVGFFSFFRFLDVIMMMISGTFSEFADPYRECTKHDILCQNISGKIMCKVHKLHIVVVVVDRGIG
jgi:hypothetical protein